MSHETIDRADLISRFHELMTPNSSYRIIRVFGESKSGKSHFLTKVFPHLAYRVYSCNCAVIDLRNPTQSVLDVLHITCGLLGTEATFPSFNSAYQAWLSQPNIEVKSLSSWFSSISIRARDESREYKKINQHLTAKFVTDLRNISDKLLLLIFDTVDQADESIQGWLMGTLLVSITNLEHVRVVVAGRTVPEAYGSYAALARDFELSPVVDIDEYIAFCSRIGVRLSDQSIRDIAHALDYMPGFFAERIWTRFMP